jgi:hypothetical protein
MAGRSHPRCGVVRNDCMTICVAPLPNRLAQPMNFTLLPTTPTFWPEKKFLTLLGGAVGWPVAASAQRPTQLPTIGYLGSSTASAQSQWVAAFVQRLHDLGWIDGRTVAIQYRWAEGRTLWTAGSEEPETSGDSPIQNDSDLSQGHRGRLWAHSVHQSARAFQI